MNKNFIDNIDSKDAILKTEDLSVFYGNTKAVDKVTFSIPRNKIELVYAKLNDIR